MAILYKHYTTDTFSFDQMSDGTIHVYGNTGMDRDCWVTAGNNDTNLAYYPRQNYQVISSVTQAVLNSNTMPLYPTQVFSTSPLYDTGTLDSEASIEFYLGDYTFRYKYSDVSNQSIQTSNLLISDNNTVDVSIGQYLAAVSDTEIYNGSYMGSNYHVYIPIDGNTYSIVPVKSNTIYSDTSGQVISNDKVIEYDLVDISYRFTSITRTCSVSYTNGDININVNKVLTPISLVKLYIDDTFIPRSELQETQNGYKYPVPSELQYGRHPVRVVIDPDRYVSNISVEERTLGVINTGYKIPYRALITGSACTTSTLKTLTIEKTLPVPSNISVSIGSRLDEIVVSWDAVDGTDSYDVYEFPSQNIYHVSNTTSFTLSNVVPNREYSFSVKSVYTNDHDYDSAWSDRYYVTPTPCIQPYNLSFTNTGIDSGTFSFTSQYPVDLNYSYDVLLDNVLYSNIRGTALAITAISPGEHIVSVFMRYEPNSNYNSATSQMNISFQRLSTPTLLQSDITSGDDITGIRLYITDVYPSGVLYRILVDDNVVAESTNKSYSIDMNSSNELQAYGTHTAVAKIIYASNTAYNSDDSNEIEYTITKLSTPIVSFGLSGKEESYLSITGDASIYEVYATLNGTANGNTITTTTGFYVPDTNLIDRNTYPTSGMNTYRCNVRGLSTTDSFHNRPSDVSYADYFVGRLSAPLNIQYDLSTYTLSWNSVENANEYIISMDNETIGTTSNTSYECDISSVPGLHTFKVIANRRVLDE